MKEEWRYIAGYEGIYEISNLGRVKSLKRIVARKNLQVNIKERILKQVIGTVGYLKVNLNLEGSQKTKYIHQMVAIAFLNHTPNGHNLIIDHINNVKTDNRAENLQIVTVRKNVSKDRKGGTSKYIGVCWNKHGNKWASAIDVKGKRNHLGYFTNEIDAHNAYQNKLKQINGQNK